MNKNQGKADLNVDFEILGYGLVDALICTRLSIKEATIRLNRELPTGISSKWEFNGEPANQAPCQDDEGKTHYRLFC